MTVKASQMSCFRREMMLFVVAQLIGIINSSSNSLLYISAATLTHLHSCKPNA